MKPLYFVFIFLVFGCKNQKQNIDILVSGSVDSNEVIWANGHKIVLKGGSRIGVKAIIANESNIYLAGSLYKTSLVDGALDIKYSPVLWQNQVMKPLDTNLKNCEATAIALSGTDTYVLGNELRNSINGGFKTVLHVWKNYKEVYMSKPLTDADGTDIAIDGSDIYIVGRKHGQATIWKNGNSNPLDSIQKKKRISLQDIFEGKGEASSSANSIFISDGNIYV